MRDFMVNELRKARPTAPDKAIADWLGGTPRPVVFDVGANVGQSVVRFKRLFPDAQIHAFEPSPTTSALLRERTARFNGVQVNACGVGRQPGTLSLNEHSTSDMSSFLPADDACWTSVRQATEVPITTVDDYCNDRAIERVSLLKSDTQGFDREVLEGAADMMREGRIDMIYTEVIFSQLYQNQPLATEYVQFILDRGYRLVGLYDFGQPDGLLGWCDALFARNGLSRATTVTD